MLGLCLFLKIIVCKDDDFSAFRATKFINENFVKCTRMYTRSMQNGIDCCNNPMSSILVATLTENAQKGSLVDCQEDVPYTALTIVCTINVSIDCDCFDVSNPSTRKNIHKIKSKQ